MIIREFEQEIVVHLTDVHKASSSSTYCLLADDPHDQLAILNVNLERQCFKIFLIEYEAPLTLVSYGDIHL